MRVTAPHADLTTLPLIPRHPLVAVWLCLCWGASSILDRPLITSRVPGGHRRCMDKRDLFRQPLGVPEGSLREQRGQEHQLVWSCTKDARPGLTQRREGRGQNSNSQTARSGRVWEGKGKNSCSCGQAQNCLLSSPHFCFRSSLLKSLACLVNL